MRRSWQPASAFSRAGRSGGRPALQLPRPANSPRQPAYLFRSRPRTTEVGNCRSGTAFSHPKRSGGRPALQLPRASNSRGSSAYRLPRDYAPQKPENPATVPLSPIPAFCSLVSMAKGINGVHNLLRVGNSNHADLCSSCCRTSNQNISHSNEPLPYPLHQIHCAHIFDPDFVLQFSNPAAADNEPRCGNSVSCIMYFYPDIQKDQDTDYERQGDNS